MAVLDVFEDERLLENASSMGNYTISRFAKLSDRHSLIGVSSTRSTRAWQTCSHESDGGMHMSGSATAEPDDFLDKMYALALVALRGRDLFARLWLFPLRRANRWNPHLRPHFISFDS